MRGAINFSGKKIAISQRLTIENADYVGLKRENYEFFFLPRKFPNRLLLGSLVPLP